jgi:hypothetical protein
MLSNAYSTPKAEREADSIVVQLPISREKPIWIEIIRILVLRFIS